jgi:ribosome-associated translation inhibitor RaiA
MQISVTGTAHDVNQQTRAYVEYRVFSALAGSSRDVDVARVTLALSFEGDHVVCHVEVTLRSGDVFRARGRALHPHQAVDCAAQRMKYALTRRGRTLRAS